MSIWGAILLAIGLSMDAFAVSICKGLSVSRLQFKHVLLCGVWFGVFQALMPTIGYFLGARFSHYLEAYDHWVAFVLLALIGCNMIREAVSGKEEEVNASFGVKAMLALAVATSIDALAAGVTFAFLEAPVFLYTILIGCITCVISMAGVKIGNKFGERYKNKAEITGGVILILLGLKILLEHLGIITSFL